MGSKEKQQYRKHIILILFLMLILIVIYLRFVPTKETFASKEQVYKGGEIKISNAEPINLEQIIENNANSLIANKEEIYEKQEELEYITKYRYNDEIYIGETKVSQEGRNGIQTIKYRQ